MGNIADKLECLLTNIIVRSTSTLGLGAGTATNLKLYVNQTYSNSIPKVMIIYAF